MNGARFRETMHEHLLVGTFDYDALINTSALIAYCEKCDKTFTAVSGQYAAARNIILKKHREAVRK